MLPTRGTPQDKRPTQTESERLEKNYSKQMDRKKKAGVAILTSGKIDFKTKAIKRNPERARKGKEAQKEWRGIKGNAGQHET